MAALAWGLSPHPLSYHPEIDLAMGIFTYQPFKGIYALGAIGFELGRFPIWLVKYLTAYGRQNPEWSFRQALSVRIFFSVIQHLATIQVKTPLPLTPGKEKERFVVIKSAATSYYKGPLAPNEDVKPTDIGASWYPAPLTTSSDTGSLTVILHLHGGAFVVGDGRTNASGYFAGKLLKHAGAVSIDLVDMQNETYPTNYTSSIRPTSSFPNTACRPSPQTRRRIRSPLRCKTP